MQRMHQRQNIGKILLQPDNQSNVDTNNGTNAEQTQQKVD